MEIKGKITEIFPVQEMMQKITENKKKGNDKITQIFKVSEKKHRYLQYKYVHKYEAINNMNMNSIYLHTLLFYLITRYIIDKITQILKQVHDKITQIMKLIEK